MKELLEQKRIIFGKDENKIIEIKLYLRELKDKLPGMIELDGRRGANELRALFPDRKKVFNNPKPVGIGEHLLGFVTHDDDIILDSFAGSGTTAHAVLALNKADHGTRRYILVECERLCRSHYS